MLCLARPLLLLTPVHTCACLTPHAFLCCTTTHTPLFCCCTHTFFLSPPTHLHLTLCPSLLSCLPSPAYCLPSLVETGGWMTGRQENRQTGQTWPDMYLPPPPPIKSKHRQKHEKILLSVWEDLLLLYASPLNKQWCGASCSLKIMKKNDRQAQGDESPQGGGTGRFGTLGMMCCMLLPDLACLSSGQWICQVGQSCTSGTGHAHCTAGLAGSTCPPLRLSISTSLHWPAWQLKEGLPHLHTPPPTTSLTTLRLPLHYKAQLLKRLSCMRFAMTETLKTKN